jgi:hypothetical protein
MFRTIMFPVCLVSMSLATARVYAVDGVVLINQSEVLAAGGFPYHITQSGSYRLSSNLLVSSATDAIDISANNVTIDLNGFSIIQTATTSPPGKMAINGSAANAVTVRNGSIANWDYSISLESNCTVQNTTITNTNTGLMCFRYSAITANLVIANPNPGAIEHGQIGISASSGTMISGNTVAGFRTYGIAMAETPSVNSPGALISGNAVSGPGGGAIGILATCPANLVGNAATGNGSNDIDAPDFGAICTRYNNDPSP